MRNRWICCLLAALVISQLAIRASAAEGRIQVNTQGSSAALYRVGTAEGNGYRLLETYGGGYLTFDDTLSQALADWLWESTAEEEQLRSDEGGSVFSNLEEGVYLVCSEADPGFPPFLVILPWDGYHWDVEVGPINTEPPQTGDPIGTAFLLMGASGAGISALCKRKKFY